MNEQLIKFIELCLMDGVITEKEREIIFRKSKELGVPEDECEIILEGMKTKFQVKSHPDKHESQKLDNYFDDSVHKSWFIKWIKTDNKIDHFKTNLLSKIHDYLKNHIDESEKKGGFSGDFIKEETLRKICELANIPDTPDSFWRKGKKGKKGSVENRFKELIGDTLDQEKFICYLSTGESQSMLGNKTFVHWGDRDLNQMIEHYNNPTKILTDEGWNSHRINPHSFLMYRYSVLITDNSIIEFKETSDYDKYECNKINLIDVGIDTFTDKSGYFKMVYQSIEGLFKSPQFSITHFLPEYIRHNDDMFIEKLKSIGLNNHTKRLINVNEKIQEFIDSKYNSQLKKTEGHEFYFFSFGTENDVMGRPRIIIKENTVTNTLHPLSLEFFNIYIRFLNFRDSLLNMYLSKNEVELEGILLKFENSNLGMSKFEQDTLSTLNQINENLIELKEVTEIGLKEISDKMGLIVEELDSLNDSNEKIIESLNFNNFISLVNLYQNYKSNMNTKGLKE